MILPSNPLFHGVLTVLLIVKYNYAIILIL